MLDDAAHQAVIFGALCAQPEVAARVVLDSLERLAGPLGERLARTPWMAPYAPALAFVIVTVGLTALSVTLAVLVCPSVSVRV